MQMVRFVDVVLGVVVYCWLCVDDVARVVGVV